MIKFEKVILSDAHESVGPVLLTDVPKDILLGTQNQINTIIDLQKSNALCHREVNNNLAGQIADQITFMLRNDLEDFVFKFANSYTALQNIKINSIEKHDTWLNLQKKHEYNPYHYHTGNLSYVLWVNVPYLMQNEDQVENTLRSRKPANGRFEFTYLSTTQTILSQRLQVDKSYEGKLILFRSSLRHCVYPFFTSDELRISVAGNLFYK